MIVQKFFVMLGCLFPGALTSKNKFLWGFFFWYASVGISKWPASSAPNLG